MFLRKYRPPPSVAESAETKIDFKPMLAYHFIAKTIRKNTFKSPLTLEVGASHGYYVVDPTGWYMSKKLNGIRGVWCKGVMKSRMALKEHDNRVIHIPQWFGDLLPDDIILDGELYLGKERFYELIPMVQGGFDKWDEVKYYLFDCYDEIQNNTFSERLATLRQVHKEIVEKWKKTPQGRKGKPCPIIYHEQYLIQSWPKAFDMFRQWVVKDHEEGAILKDPSAKYEQKRSYSMLKWKIQHKQKATIVGYNMNPSKPNMLKSLRCSWLGSKGEFSVSGGLNPKLRQKYLDIFPIGDTITISYYETTMNDKPLSAVIVFDKR